MTKLLHPTDRTKYHRRYYQRHRRKLLDRAIKRYRRIVTAKFYE